MPSTDSPAAPDPALARALTAPGLVCIGLGATIGAGIFVLTGTAAAHYAGPALVLSFVIGGLVSGLVGLCYAELAAMIPQAGSTYAYTRVSLGLLPAWLIGWDLVLEFALAAATVAVGWSGYARSLMADVGLHLPPALCAGPGEGGVVDLPAVGIVLVLTALLTRGVREASWINGALVALKVAIILAFVGLGAAFVSPALWQPFVPPNTGEFGHFGTSGVLRGAAVVFFAYIGFETVSTAAGECRDPQADAPTGLIGSLLLSTLLYVAVAAVLTGLVAYRDLDVPDPIAKAVDVIGYPGLSLFVKLGALLGLTTSTLTALYGQGRIFYAMARDRLLPGAFARVDRRTRVPAASQWMIGLCTAAVAGLVPIDVLGELVSIGTLLAFGLVCASVPILRRRRPDLPRPFRVPAADVVAGLGLAACAVLMASLPPETWIRLALWLGLGLAIYAGYGRARARANP
ncbi:amino acid permease [Methylobacterium aerolatum]|uniref:APA family basic amino acid/polyamine antiporter n=1 Tax=Methylobacterium aerolatum TaxID=418708 RepID=A0ABU0HWD1_9HYPH|nr:amino acid permease [Methylobacterium aerolatum]MDQ0446642.1 APA family basic amino acid/polyamine antiporter [Methylobacterium aerolatum]GJD33609.1 putative amino acid permease YhdG [Methylobacterium aerolatum]